MKARQGWLPAVYATRIEDWLKGDGYTLANPRPLADAVKQLSDHYIAQPEGTTPWHKPWARAAYAAYFFPLNYARLAQVTREAMAADFFAGLTTSIDFGAGPGTATLAIEDHLTGHFRTRWAIDRDLYAERAYRHLATGGCPVEWARTIDPVRRHAAARTLGIFSYSLTEVAGLPGWAFDCGGLMIVEPATHQDGRALLALRAQLLQRGFHAYGPCTHQAECPLLTDSARDWCHDRVDFVAPPWFDELERHLPMRNRSITMSWLLMAKRPRPESPGCARVTGDAQVFKGVTRQMVCRGPKREFLAFQHRDGAAPELPRGAVITLAADTLVKGRELRPTPGQIGNVDPS